MELFRVLRPHDVNLEACVDSVPGQPRELILFDSPALNTVSSEQADQSIRAGKEIGRQAARTTTLTAILDAHMPSGRVIDFLTIDVEGLDEVILRTHDFAKYRPRVLVFERNGLDPMCVGSDPLVSLLTDIGYRLVAITGASVVMTSR